MADGKSPIISLYHPVFPWRSQKLASKKKEKTRWKWKDRHAGRKDRYSGRSMAKPVLPEADIGKIFYFIDALG